MNGTVNYEYLRYSLDEASTNIWLMASTGMIFFMQSGFALLECGSIREKNAQGILLKNIFDSCIGCLGFWLIGYGIAYGDSDHQVNNGKGTGGFIGTDGGYYAGAKFQYYNYDNYMKWIFQYAFAATAATIVSGSLAERCQISTYVFFSFFMTSFIYSVVVFWVWGGGWLKIGGYHDYAGSSCVHLVGGTCAFWGAYMLGERYGKKRDREIKEGRRDPNMRKSLGFEHKEIVQVLESVHEDYHEAFKEYLVNQTDEFRPYNPAFMILGTLLLWVCWLFFNAGSIPTISIRRCNNAPKICMINIISPAVSGLFCVFIKPHITNEYSAVNKFDIGTFCNGIIVGLVAVTANCDNVEPWAAAVIGVVAATMYSYGCKFIHKIHVDDPVEAAPLHFSGGSWGTIAVGLFDVDRGLFYAKSGGWGFLGWQLVGVIAIVSWVSCIVIPFFWTLNKFHLFRMSKEMEVIGTDISEMGGIPQWLYDKLKQEYSTYITPGGSKIGIPGQPDNIESLVDDINKENENKRLNGLNDSEISQTNQFDFQRQLSIN